MIGAIRYLLTLGRILSISLLFLSMIVSVQAAETAQKITSDEEADSPTSSVSVEAPGVLAAKAKLTEVEDIIDALSAEWDRLQTRCAAVQAATGEDVVLVRQAKAELEAQVETLSKDKADLKNRMDTLQVDYQRIQETWQELEKKLTTVGGQLSEVQSSRTELKDRVEQLEQQNEGINQEKSLLQAQLGTSEAELVKMGQAVEGAQSKAKELAGALEKSRQEKAALADKLQALEEELKALRQTKQVSGSESGSSARIQQNYTVQKGDTLSSIAIKFYNNPKDWQKIFRANRAILGKPSDLKLGMSLMIP